MVYFSSIDVINITAYTKQVLCNINWLAKIQSGKYLWVRYLGIWNNVNFERFDKSVYCKDAIGYLQPLQSLSHYIVLVFLLWIRN